MKEIIQRGSKSIRNAIKNAQTYLEEDKFNEYIRIEKST